MLGASVLGFMTALGGGTIRDILANRVPSVFETSSDVFFASAGVVAAFFIFILTKKDISSNIAVKVSDAIGLAAFTVIGSSVGIERGLNVIGVILLGVVTGVGGGLISDILTLKVPMVLSEDFYATCSISGALWLYIVRSIGLSSSFAIYSAFFVVLGLRLSALLFKWKLPKF